MLQNISLEIGMRLELDRSIFRLLRLTRPILIRWTRPR